MKKFMFSILLVVLFSFPALAMMAPDSIIVSLQDGTVNIPYSQTLNSTGASPISWSITNGSLPPGLNLNPNTGVISGIPSKMGNYVFTVRASNSKGNTTRVLSINIPNEVIPPTIVVPPSAKKVLYYDLLTRKNITIDQLATINNKAPCTLGLSATGTGPITWSIVGGSLPGGMGLMCNGTIFGTANIGYDQSGGTTTFMFTVKATNAAGSDTKAFGLGIYQTPDR